MEQKILKKIVMTKPVKLRRINQFKWCPKCNDLVKINMVAENGFCPHDGCWRKLYTIDARFNASNFGSENRR